MILPEHKFCKLMLVGPQGCGKTTLMGKIAYEYKRQGRKVALTSVDFARPAAIEQAKQLSKTAECTYFDTDQFGSIASNLQATASLVDSKGYDLLLIDTAGRQFVDQDLMDEVSVLQSALQPNEVIYVVDALSGQNAAQSAKQFADSVHVTGLALTKADGDALAGAALSAVYMTGKPIKLVGRGERITDLDDVDPQSLAGQILNLGDLSSLIKEFEKRGAMKVPPNAKEIDMLQLRDQIKTWLDIGVENILGRLPGMASMPKEMTKSFDSKMLVKMAAVIDSMTKQERAYPAIIRSSRKKRIANGAGVDPKDVTKFLNTYEKMKKSFKMLKSPKMMKMMEQLSKMKGGMGDMLSGLGSMGGFGGHSGDGKK